MPEWLADIFSFLKSILWRWVNLVGCAAFAFAEVVFPKLTHGGQFPVDTWWILGGCLFCATYLAWRNEHHKARTEDRFGILTKIVDLLTDSGLQGMDQRYDPIGALIKFSADVKTEKDVEWICAELKARDHGDPFLFFEFQYGANSASGKRLKFIQDARLSGHKTRLDINASDYLNTVWAEQNGLHPIPYSSTPEGPQQAEEYRTWKEKMARRRFKNKEG